MFGRELRGGGWYPDYQLRLLRRARARYVPEREVHEIVELDGEIGTLNSTLLHLNYDSFDEFHRKQTSYSHLRAAELSQQGENPRRRSYVGRPARELWRRFVTLHGYRDGLVGLRLALAMARYELEVLEQLNREPSTSDEQSTQEQVATETSPPSFVNSTPPDLDLSIIIVSYNVRHDLLNCLASIEAWLAETNNTVEVIVVDNASHDGSPDSVRRRFPDSRIIELDVNAGFAAANNRGVESARGRFIAFLNPDTTVVGNAFGLMLRHLRDNPEVGVIGPRIQYPDGSVQSTRRRFPTRRTGFVESTIVQQYWHDNSILRRYYVSDRPNDETQDVDWLVGACLVTRRETIGGRWTLR